MRSSLVRPVLLALAVLAAPSAHAQRAGDGPFDSRSGRFASVLPSGPVRPTDTLAAPVAQAWGAVARVYADLGIPISIADTQSHVLGAMRVTHRRLIGGERLSRLFECGTGSFGANADRYTVQVTVLSLVQALPDGRSTLDTRVGGIASPNGLNSSVTCGSTGVLEERITTELQKALKG